MKINSKHKPIDRKLKNQAQFILESKNISQTVLSRIESLYPEEQHFIYKFIVSEDSNLTRKSLDGCMFPYMTLTVRNEYKDKLVVLGVPFLEAAERVKNKSLGQLKELLEKERQYRADEQARLDSIEKMKRTYSPKRITQFDPMSSSALLKKDDIRSRAEFLKQRKEEYSDLHTVMINLGFDVVRCDLMLMSRSITEIEDDVIRVWEDEMENVESTLKSVLEIEDVSKEKILLVNEQIFAFNLNRLVSRLKRESLRRRYTVFESLYSDYAPKNKANLLDVKLDLPVIEQIEEPIKEPKKKVDVVKPSKGKLMHDLRRKLGDVNISQQAINSTLSDEYFKSTISSAADGDLDAFNTIKEYAHSLDLDRLSKHIAKFDVSEDAIEYALSKTSIVDNAVNGSKRLMQRLVNIAKGFDKERNVVAKPLATVLSIEPSDIETVIETVVEPVSSIKEIQANVQQSLSQLVQEVEKEEVTSEMVSKFIAGCSASSLKGLLNRGSEIIISSVDVNRIKQRISELESPVLHEPRINTIKEVERKTKQRTEQSYFRANGLILYPSCVVSGSTMQNALDAAHIQPANGKNDTICNCLMLRKDLHKLFDDYCWSIEPTTKTVVMSELMKSDPCYSMYQDKQLDIVADAKYLKEHYDKFLNTYC